ncbi:putative alkane 1-monooxygenase [Medicago truncatula]|uniref:Putative alkane 1-monooxygenase n=1 Tax=Medicago truncatula TaxID=3880 RepID=A0A396GU12_MEDTR|nr:putative alkane 1-monooxygenase [Medicago truncatula]
MTKTNTSNMAAATEILFSHIILVLKNIQITEIIIAAIVFIFIRSLRSKKHHGHGLTNWPIFGMLPYLIKGLKINLYEWITDILKHHNGTSRFRGAWFTSLNYVITEPRNLEHVLKTKFTVYPKGNYFRDIVSELLGDGIFTADNETWQKQRKIASIEFHSTNFRKLTNESIFELVNNRLIPVLELSLKKNVAIDLQDILLRLTFDNVCMIAFGVDPGCLQPHLPEIPFAGAFEDATEAILFRFVVPICVWKAMRFLNLGMERKLKKSIQKVDEFAENVIRARKKELSLQNEDDKEKSDLLTVFMRLKDENGKSYSDKFLRDICVNFILAGRDTSSVALSWFFWLVDQNHEVEEKILEEICRVVDIKKDEFDDCLRFRSQEIKKMDYLHAALSEALRLYPSVPVDRKEVVEDDIFPNGIKLKKGTKVIYAIYSMGRMENI